MVVYILRGRLSGFPGMGETRAESKSIDATKVSFLTDSPPGIGDPQTMSGKTRQFAVTRAREKKWSKRRGDEVT